MLPNSNPIQKYQFIHHFVPHPEHKTRATLLSHQALFFYSFILVLFLTVFKVIPVVAPGVLGYASDISTNELLSETNKIRRANGLEPLQLNSTLNSAAQKKAEHMFEENYWAHISPSGVKPWDFILGAGYDYLYAGENLAKNFDKSNQVVSAWYDSPSHRENLLNSNYNEIGFAVVNGVLDGYETTLVVQMFGKTREPATLARVPEVETATDQLIPATVPATALDQSSEPLYDQDSSGPVTVSIPSQAIVADVNSIYNVRPAFTIDMQDVSKLLLSTFVVFIISLLSLDIWYSKKKSIPKVSGHAIAHLTFLIVILGSIWLVMSPGKIL